MKVTFKDKKEESISLKDYTNGRFFRYEEFKQVGTPKVFRKIRNVIEKGYFPCVEVMDMQTGEVTDESGILNIIELGAELTVWDKK